MEIIQVSLPHNALTICPIGDIQYGSQACDLRQLHRDISYAMGRGAYFIGMGDYIDPGSPSNRLRLRNADLYDSLSQLIEEGGDRKLEELMAHLDPTRNRWLGLLEGHHFIQYSDGQTTDTKLADCLQTRFVGDCVVYDITFGV